MKTEPETKPAHSPEPWQPLSGFAIADKTGGRVADLFRAYDGTNSFAADRDRIIACVNVLAGLNPEAIADAVAALEAYVNVMETTKLGASLRKAAHEKATAALAKLRQ